MQTGPGPLSAGVLQGWLGDYSDVSLSAVPVKSQASHETAGAFLVHYIDKHNTPLISCVLLAHILIAH